MNAKMINAPLEIRDVNTRKLLNPRFLATLGHYLGDLFHGESIGEGNHHLDLFGDWKDVRSEGGHVLFHAFAGHLDDFFGEHDSSMTFGVLCFVDCLVGFFVGSLDSDNIQQLVHGSHTIPPIRGENHGSTSTSKQGVLQQKRPLIPMVQIGSNDLGGNHQGLRSTSKYHTTVTLTLNHVFGQIDADQRSATSHSAEVVRHDIRPHTKLGHHQGAEGGGGREQRTVNDQDVDLLGVDLGFFQRLVHHVADHGLGFQSRCLHASIGLASFQTLYDSGWPSRGLSGAASFQNALHEFERFVVEALLVLHHSHNLLMRRLPTVGCLERRKAHQVHRIFHPRDPKQNAKHQKRYFHLRAEQRFAGFIGGYDVKQGDRVLEYLSC
mmetsp:Transcript_6648/g.9720  ORF Transcript_6648/g.9720 Transcript_6648/m.9720 type:complete len:380 (+) Transcript_6648:475-1614(+)